MTSFMERAKLSLNILLRGEARLGSGDILTSSIPSAFNSSYRYDTTQSVLAPIQTRISIDASSIPIRHVLLDENERFAEVKQSELNDRLSIMANIDQSGTALIQDAIMTMLGDGACALVPIEVSGDPDLGTYEILSLRVATITEWMNRSVRLDVYDENTGTRKEIVLPKSYVAICYNPMYAVMNEPNSTLRRLVDKLALLDVADGNLYSPQLDLILQLPYTLKNEKRESEAARRTGIIADQLYNSRYGIVYTDPTEKITQLNRPVTNTLADQVESLWSSLHSQLGLTPSIFSGTASQEELLFYNNRTVLPVLKSLIDGMIGAFFSRTAIRQGNSIMAFPNLFKMAPLEAFAEASDKLTRNAIMSSNEIRQVVGLKPSKEPDADALRNKNLNQSDNVPIKSAENQPATEDNKENNNGG